MGRRVKHTAPAPERARARPDFTHLPERIAPEDMTTNDDRYRTDAFDASGRLYFASGPSLMRVTP